MTTRHQRKKFIRHTDDDRISELQARIAAIKARGERKKAREDPDVRLTVGAVRLLDKALNATHDAVARRTIEAARQDLGAFVARHAWMEPTAGSTEPPTQVANRGHKARAMATLGRGPAAPGQQPILTRVGWITTGHLGMTRCDHSFRASYRRYHPLQQHARLAPTIGESFREYEGRFLLPRMARENYSAPPAPTRRRSHTMLLHCEVKPDHLERLATARRPLLAVAELIWNSLDADATSVEIEVQRNELGGISLIRVADDGRGISIAEAEAGFRNLGGSWKKNAHRTKSGRMLHGKDGQGRFKAFALGSSVTWKSRFRDGQQAWSLTISGRRAVLTDMEVSDPVRVEGLATGTLVEISGIVAQHSALDDAQSVAKELALRFALYLRKYPAVSLRFNNVAVDRRDAESHFAEYNLPPIVLGNGALYEAALDVIEWKIDTERALYFCDASGVAIEERAPGVKEPGFTFTAYLKSDAVRELDEQGAFALDDLHPDVQKLHAVAKAGIKSHFRSRRSILALGLIEQWKAERVYPYEGEPKSVIERAEREVFDVVAMNVNDYLPQFEESGEKNKRFSLRLLREAIESSPTATQRIIRDVLELPAEKAADLATLLQRTTLSAIINASKTVADRLDFLAGVEMLLFNPTSKEQLLERAQLQHILEEQSWLFGEEYALSVADQSLTEVLSKHQEILGREPGADREQEVRLPDGRRGIVDLMLSRSLIPQSQPESRQHLVVELKRPSQKITRKVLEQIDSYALAVAGDARFRDTTTTWEFWAVSNELDDAARQRVSQKDRPFGLLVEYDTPARIRVWAVSWGRIIEACRARLHFYKEKLDYSATDESALQYLHKVHEKYLPPIFASQPNGSVDDRIAELR